MKKLSFLALITLVAASAVSAADITGVITLKGTAPAEKVITPLVEDAVCGKLHATPPTTQFYVVDSKGDLADVVVQLKGVTGPLAATTKPAEIDQKGCLYVPQIIAVQAGQKIVVKNSDPMMHNVHINPTDAGNNQANNSPTQMPNSPDITMSFSKPENFLKFQCDVHPWMFAWVTVVDGPYFSLSAKDGTFKIANVPAGKYTIEATHRKLGTMSAEIEVKDGGATQNFTFEVK
jgi:plastocyanin